MAGSRAAWEDQAKPKDVLLEEPSSKEKTDGRPIDKIPGDKGSLVDKIRQRNLKTVKRMKDEAEDW